MTNPMIKFAIFHHRNFLGYVNAVSMKQAKARAAKLFPAKRLELDYAEGRQLSDADKVNAARTYQAKRAPYDTGDFEARRKAAIATYA